MKKTVIKPHTIKRLNLNSISKKLSDDRQRRDGQKVKRYLKLRVCCQVQISPPPHKCFIASALAISSYTAFVH